MSTSGLGVALALPTLIATGSTTLPPHRFATGTGVLNMGRQLGFTIGVAIAVAILGVQGGASLSTFQGASLAAAAIALLAAASSVRLGGSEAVADRAPVAPRESVLPAVAEAE
jgi:MFS family permease